MTSFPPSKEENVAVWSVFPLQDMPEVVRKKVSKIEKQQIPEWSRVLVFYLSLIFQERFIWFVVT